MEYQYILIAVSSIIALVPIFLGRKLSYYYKRFNLFFRDYAHRLSIYQQHRYHLIKSKIARNEISKEDLELCIQELERCETIMSEMADSLHKTAFKCMIKRCGPGEYMLRSFPEQKKIYSHFRV